MKTTKEFLSSGEYLPSFLRDFHAQKDLFKTIHQTYENETLKKVNWIDGHCYTVDNFLWFMAQHGYTLQKSKAKVEFKDLQKTLCDAENQRTSDSVSTIKQFISNLNQDGVHNSHCCGVCGSCKYGDDDCPVLQGQLSGIICQDCAEEDDFPINNLTKEKTVLS